MTILSEGDIVAIPLPGGREAFAQVLYLSKYFKDVIGFAVYGVKKTLGPADVEMEPNDPLVLYTNVLAAAHYKWRVLSHRAMTKRDRLLTKRVVGGEVWIGDEHLGPAADADAQLHRMLVEGMPIVYKKIATTFAK